MIDPANITFFAPLSAETMDKVKRCWFQKTFPAGSMIFLQGEPCTIVYWVVEGEVQVFRTAEEGRQQAFSHVPPGFSFNSGPPLTPFPFNFINAKAVTDTILVCLPVDDYINLIQTIPEFAFALLKDLAMRMVGFANLIENLSLHSVRGRLANFLILHAESPRHWTQDELAEQLGTVRDVIGRNLRDFMAEGLIRRERHRIILVDREGLEREAKS
ncbi:MAG TPA: Crp/Fnr family transcriptional regulator [Longilinea sp.]|nr:Crp/Fnr family transcriptional regulator [Longilinea sp.]